jgi:hypothetical protein
MTELEDTVILANKILDRISADPDDDLAMLSRQFLRGREEITRLEGLCSQAADALTVHSFSGQCNDLINELRKAATYVKANPELNQINIADLVFILDHAAEFFTVAENTTWALRYKEHFSKKQQYESNT